jgi:hypothetical protein
MQEPAVEDARKPVCNDLDSLPIREIDEAQPTDIDQDAPHEEHVQYSNSLAIVLAPRPFAYREPVGSPNERRNFHPKRRRTDRGPQK